MLSPLQTHLNNSSRNLYQCDITRRVHRSTNVPVGYGSTSDVTVGVIDGNTLHQQNVAIKTFRGTPAELPLIEQRLDREVSAWVLLSHRNILPFLGIVYNVGLSPGLVSPFLPEDILSYISKHPDRSTKLRVIREVAEGLKHIHDCGVVHGDVKSDNIMVNVEGVVQIIDYGFSQIVGVNDFATAIAQNARYSAPELLPVAEDAPGTIIRPTYQSDVYSFSMTMLEIYNSPASESGFKSIPYNHIPRRGYDFGLPALVWNGARPIRERYDPISDNHWNLLCECWSHLPGNRPSMVRVLERL